MEKYKVGDKVTGFSTRTQSNKGQIEIFPSHQFVNNWLFQEDEKDEASLAHYVAKVAEKNGMSANDIHHIYPAILRMLRSNIEWANNVNPKSQQELLDTPH